MPKVSAAHLEARRRGILAAAQRCVSRKGVAATTMRDICRAANLSPGGVYRYFTGKGDILKALAEQRQRQMRRFFDRLCAAPLDREEMIGRLVDLASRLDAAAAQDGLRLDAHLWSEALSSTATRRRLRAGHDEIFTALSATLPASEGASRATLARFVLALLQGLALQKALEPELELDAMARELERFLAR